MKSITKELLQFAVIGGIATVLFRLIVTICINHNTMAWIWPILGAYFCVMFFGAICYGKRDWKNNHIRDIGFRFHLLLYLLYVGINELWFLIGLGAEHDPVSAVHAVVLYWGIGIVVHFALFMGYRLITSQKTYSNGQKINTHLQSTTSPKQIQHEKTCFIGRGSMRNRNDGCMPQRKYHDNVQ